MATYTSFSELKDEQLKKGDVIQFKVKNEKLHYVVQSSFLANYGNSNSIIFDKLGISNKNSYASCKYGYTITWGEGPKAWPEYHEDDYIAATKLVCALFKKCESVKEESYELGDFVKIKEQDDPNHIIGFTKEMIEEYGGRWCRIQEIKENGWFILDTAGGNPMKNIWSKYMFSEHRKISIDNPYKKNILVEASNFSFTKKDIPENCPYHPYVIDQALVEFSKGINPKINTLEEAFRYCIHNTIGSWFIWSSTIQGQKYWENICDHPHFIPSCYIPTYFIEELPAGAEELVEYCKRDISDAIVQYSSRTFHNSMEIPCSYEEVTLSIKKKKVHF